MNADGRSPRTPKYRLHKPRNRAVVTIDGRDYYLGPYNSLESKAEYDRLIALWLANGRRMPADDPDDLTIDQVIAAFWRHAKVYYVKNGKPTNEQATVKVAMKVLRRLYGTTLARNFGPLKLKLVREAMIEQGWCRNHINKQISRLKSVFKWAVAEELVPASVHQGLVAVAGLKPGRCRARESEPVKPVPDAHVDAIKSHVSRQVWAMIELQRLTGMRSGEVTIMRASDLETTERVWTYRPAVHKTEHHGHQRIIYIGPRACEVLRPFLRADLAAYLFSPAEAETERFEELRRRRKRRVQPSQRARSHRRADESRRRPPQDHYTTDSYRRAIARGCKAAGVEPVWHPHQLRHNAATWIRKEVGIEVARIALGHRSAAITEVYAEMDSAKAIEAISRIG